MLLKYKEGFYIKKSSMYVISCVMILFAISFIFNNNSMLYQYFREFIMFGFITVHLFSRVKDLDKFLLYSAIFHTALFLISFTDAFQGYNYYSGYMAYGLFCILPSFLLFHIQRRYYHRLVFLVPELLAIVGALFSNRNTILICVIGVIALDLSLTERKTDVKFKIAAFGIAGIAVITNLSTLLNFIQVKFNIDSYAIRALINWVSGENNGLTGRDDIWANAFSEIFNHPILGIGFGGFHSKYGMYCHNLFVDIVSSLGIVGVPLIIICIVMFIRKYKSRRNRLFIVFITILGVLPLLFNTYFIVWKPFWIAICYVFSRDMQMSTNDNEINVLKLQKNIKKSL